MRNLLPHATAPNLAGGHSFRHNYFDPDRDAWSGIRSSAADKIEFCLYAAPLSVGICSLHCAAESDQAYSGRVPVCEEPKDSIFLRRLVFCCDSGVLYYGNVQQRSDDHGAQHHHTDCSDCTWPDPAKDCKAGTGERNGTGCIIR